MASGETKRQEMTSGDIPVCRIPLLICFESTGCDKCGGIMDKTITWEWTLTNVCTHSKLQNEERSGMMIRR